MGLQLETGRWFTSADLTAGGTGKGVAMVNRAFARKYFHGESPLGRRLLSGDRKESFEIIGVAADYRAMGAENEARAEIFRPSMDFDSATLLVRGGGAPQFIARALLVARSVAPNVVSDKVKPVGEYADYWTSQRRFNTLLLGIFASLALVLAMSGIYGVLSNLVMSRTRELGIRMAVGATPRAIGWLVMRQSMGPLAIGTLVGLGGCLALGRLMQSLLFQVQARDPVALGASLAVILLTSPAALWLPLRRATAVDCTVALREE
jgi:ABC-type antimicrobial peptide transport system permease subunit